MEAPGARTATEATEETLHSIVASVERWATAPGADETRLRVAMTVEEQADEMLERIHQAAQPA